VRVGRYRHLWALCLCSRIHECRKTSIFTASSAPAFIDEGVPKGSGFGTPHSGEPFRKQAVDSARRRAWANPKYGNGGPPSGRALSSPLTCSFPPKQIRWGATLLSLQDVGHSQHVIETDYVKPGCIFYLARRLLGKSLQVRNSASVGGVIFAEYSPRVSF